MYTENFHLNIVKYKQENNNNKQTCVSLCGILIHYQQYLLLNGKIYTFYQLSPVINSHRINTTYTDDNDVVINDNHRLKST